MNSAALAHEGRLPFDRWSWAAMLYLALPWPLFALGWLKPWLGWPLTALLLAMLALLWRQTRPALERTPWWQHLLLLAVASIWTVLSGIGNWVHANPDWFTRYNVLRDLSVASWPVTYATANGDYLLRCPLSYYLPVAALGRWLEVQCLVQILILWTAVGVLIWLQLLPLVRSSLVKLLFGILIIVLFSGMDVLGYLLNNGSLPLAGDHIEWWAVTFQYSSNTTLLFWVPNHALPAWLAMALCYRHWRQPGFLGWAGLCLGLLPLWTPFAALGLLPFFGLATLRALKYALRTRLGLRSDGLLWPSSLLCVVGLSIGLVSSIYLLANAGHIPQRNGSAGGGGGFVQTYLSFVLCEFGILALLLWKPMCSTLLGVALAILLGLPWLSFGPSNDLVMRASIPALLVLAIVASRYLLETNTGGDRRRRNAVIVVLLIGAITPGEEFIRAFQYRPMRMDTRHSLLDNDPWVPEHYATRASHPWLKAILRTATPLPALSRQQP